MRRAKRQKGKAGVPNMRNSRRKPPMRLDDPGELKERQTCKIRELAHSLVAVGFISLDEQADALGLSRSTTWTILQAKHKNYGLSGALVNRILQRPGLNRR